MKASFLTILITAFISTSAFAHGMNKTGEREVTSNYKLPLSY